MLANNSDGAADIVREALSAHESGEKKKKRRDVIGVGDNSAKAADADAVRGTVERLERIRDEMAGLKSDEKEILAEAKKEGIDLRAVNSLLAEKRLSPEKKVKREQRQETVDLYRRWLGLTG